MCDKNNILLERIKGLIDTDTRENIAKALGCDTSYITKQYNGDRTITIDYVCKYAKHFNVSTDYILGFSNTPSNDPNITMICEYTGLNKDTVNLLNKRFGGNAEDIFKAYRDVIPVLVYEDDDIENWLSNKLKTDIDIFNYMLCRFIDGETLYYRYLVELERVYNRLRATNNLPKKYDKNDMILDVSMGKKGNIADRGQINSILFEIQEFSLNLAKDIFKQFAKERKITIHNIDEIN